MFQQCSVPCSVTKHYALSLSSRSLLQTAGDIGYVTLAYLAPLALIGWDGEGLGQILGSLRGMHGLAGDSYQWQRCYQYPLYPMQLCHASLGILWLVPAEDSRPTEQWALPVDEEIKVPLLQGSSQIASTIIECNAFTLDRAALGQVVGDGIGSLVSVCFISGLHQQERRYQLLENQNPYMKIEKVERNHHTRLCQVCYSAVRPRSWENKKPGT